MANLTEERVSHLAHLAVEAIRTGARITNDRLALLEAKKILARHFRAEDDLDDKVRGRIPRRVPPGSPEWDILYRKYMEEELRKTRGG